MLAPRGCVCELIYPKALKLCLVFIRQAEKKRIGYDGQGEAPLAIRHRQDRLIGGQAAVVFAEMDEETMVGCEKNHEKFIGS